MIDCGLHGSVINPQYMNRNSQRCPIHRSGMGGIDVILLAAGRSSRLGQPKALVDVDGQP